MSGEDLRGRVGRPAARTGIDAAAVFTSAPPSVAAARRFVGEHLGTRPGAPLARLLVSELATNAVLHGEGPFEVRVVASGEWVRIEVRDRGDALPRRSPAGEHGAGRGLRIVDALAAAWGVEPLHAGKAVWFEV